MANVSDIAPDGKPIPAWNPYDPWCDPADLRCAVCDRLYGVLVPDWRTGVMVHRHFCRFQTLDPHRVQVRTAPPETAEAVKQARGTDKVAHEHELRSPPPPCPTCRSADVDWSHEPKLYGARNLPIAPFAVCRNCHDEADHEHTAAVRAAEDERRRQREAEQRVRDHPTYVPDAARTIERAASSPSSNSIYVPKRPKDLTRWRAIWQKVKGEYRKGELSYAEMATWVKRLHPALDPSPDLIGNICRAGDAGLLD